MYQKSPFPYLFILTGIIVVSSLTNLTIDKQIEEPIVYKVTPLKKLAVDKKAQAMLVNNFSHVPMKRNLLKP